MHNEKLALFSVLAAFGLGLAPGVAAAQLPHPGECPQPRFTGKAPDEYYLRKSPLETPDAQLGAQLFAGSAPDGSCAMCHGRRGDGKGPLAKQYDPPPRNFACAMTVNGVPDGQLFWIIRFGSPGTAMPPHSQLSDTDVWQLVAYLRTLAKSGGESR
jgi:mono/diheme cytochrome c family protein